MSEEREAATAAWLSIAWPPGGGTHMRITEEGAGRLVVNAVYVHGPEVTASVLQSIPVSHLATAASYADSLFGYLTVLRYGGFPYPVSIEHGNHDEPPMALLRDQAVNAPATLRLIHQVKTARPRLTRPDGTDPDGFAERVADAYREYVMETRSPALRIAEEAGVPIATARSWIREARRRGKLQAGRKGRAG